MKKVLLLLVSVSFFFSCGNENEVNPVEDSLKNVTQELGSQVNQKDSTIGSFIKAFNDIQDNLDSIKNRENIVAKNTASGDVKNREDQIQQDIQAIYDFMNDNKKKLASMTRKMKKANVKIEELEKMVARLTAQLEAKDIEINDLKSKVEQLNIELTNLNLVYEEEKQESELKTEKLNTAFYTFGTSKELQKNGVLTKEGGFIGIGKTSKLKEDFNREYFTQIDVTKATSFTLVCKKAKVITTHPAGSYKIEGTENKVERFVITNPDEFWSVSKYLVIVIEP